MPTQGIGPTYSSKASRSGLRVGDLEFFDTFKETFLRLVENKKKVSKWIRVELSLTIF